MKVCFNVHCRLIKFIRTRTRLQYYLERTPGFDTSHLKTFSTIPPSPIKTKTNLFLNKRLVVHRVQKSPFDSGTVTCIGKFLRAPRCTGHTDSKYKRYTRRNLFVNRHMICFGGEGYSRAFLSASVSSGCERAAQQS